MRLLRNSGQERLVPHRDERRFPYPGARGYQLFGRNYQAEVPDSALPLRHATGTSRRLDGEKTMESFVDGICNLIGFYLVLGSMLGIYMRR